MHFKVGHGDVLLTTQLYFEGDEFLEADPWVQASRTVPVSDVDGVLRASFDVTLAAG